MGKTKIEWCDFSFNPWVGCTKISAACDHCYAESWAKRIGQASLWQGGRRRTADANWGQPLKWNAKARSEGVRRKVFCASLADVFDNQVPEKWRQDLWFTIALCDSLDWLLLTKRPQNIAKMLPKRLADGQTVADWPWPNVWLGTTVENQEEADRRIPQLLAVPAKVHFLSCEPLLSGIDLTKWLQKKDGAEGCDSSKTTPSPLTQQGAATPDKSETIGPSATSQSSNGEARIGSLAFHPPSAISWVIAGGESGPHARPMHPDWARSLRDQCAAAGVPFHFKQWGEWLSQRDDNGSISYGGDRFHPFGEDDAAYRVGKKAAGRLLDGVEHNGFPT